jgi:Domain of unknown function (4846)
MIKYFVLTAFGFSFFACNGNESKPNVKIFPTPTKKVTTYYSFIKDIPLPEDYALQNMPANSFAAWLSNIPLKKDNTVYLYNGAVKQNQQAQFAVLDISVGNKNLQQCADAVMRMRAEYLFAQNKMVEMQFVDNEGAMYKFTEPFTRVHLAQYLDRVFGMCGSASLAKQLQHKSVFENIAAGDVIIRGGFPGHAVMVMAVVENTMGKKIYLLAQSYMPAQDIHVLQNPTNENLSPWYEVNDDDIIQTPEYTFRKNELMQW